MIGARLSPLIAGMLRVHQIESFDRPELEPYKTMKMQREHHQQGIFVAEGEKVSRRLLQSELEAVSMILPEKWLPEFSALCEARQETIDLYVAEKKLLEQLTGFSMYQGVLAVGKIPRSRTLEEALELAARPRLFMAVDGISSAENLGGLIRNCAAFGAHALVTSQASCHPYLRRSVRSSMGTIFQTPYVEATRLSRTLEQLRERGVRIVAAHPHTDKRTLAEADFCGDCCIVLGSEGAGISPEVLDCCDEAVAIPMAGGVDSLNVGTAGAVFLYEARRQRAGAY